MNSDSSHERLDRIEAIAERTASNIEALTDQVGMFTEGLTEMRITMKEEMAEIRASLKELNNNSERQERHIDRLVGIVETLISQQAQ